MSHTKMTITINMFLKQAIMEKSIPFKIQVPQNRTIVSNFETSNTKENLVEVETATYHDTLVLITIVF